MDEVAVREKVDSLHSVLEDIQSGKVIKLLMSCSIHECVHLGWYGGGGGG